MKTFVTLVAMLLLQFMVYSQEITYRNPIIAGDFPDPTVIRVGDTYFAAGTSGESAPPYRLYESKDLVNWTCIGSIFKDVPSWTMGSFWAPELFYHNGTYFVYYTARRSSDRKSFVGVGSTRDIRQGFTDHGIIVEWTNEAIDAYVIELDGKLYFTWKAYGLDQGRVIEILCSELTDDGLKLKGEVFSLVTANVNDWEAGGVEGQCLVKHGDYIYMFYAGNACCGAQCNYMIGVARARSIRGPWERYSGNPIMYGGGQWRCPGHGTLVATPEGRYFYLYHAYKADNGFNIGRQCMMDEIIWDAKTGWPYFRYGKIPSIQAAVPHAGIEQKPVPNFLDKFDAGSLNPEWIWSASQKKPSYQIKDGKLFLEGTDSPAGTYIGVQARTDNYRMQATVEKGALPAGISLGGGREQGYGLSRVGDKVELWQSERGGRTVLASEELQGYEKITLFLEIRFGQNCQFGFLRQDGQRQLLGTSLPVRRSSSVGIHVIGEGTGIFDEVSVRYE